MGMVRARNGNGEQQGMGMVSSGGMGMVSSTPFYSDYPLDLLQFLANVLKDT